MSERNYIFAAHYLSQSAGVLPSDPSLKIEAQAVQSGIEKLKAGDGRSAESFAKCLMSHLLAALRVVTFAICPMPGSREGRQGPELLARHLVKRMAAAKFRRPLERSEPIDSSRKLRHQGIDGHPPEKHAQTMVCSEVPPEPLIFLVDDVVTTGSTFEGATRVLRAAGYEGEIQYVTAAKTYRGDVEALTEIFVSTPTTKAAAPYDQPVPKPGRGDVTADVIEDLKDRSAVGTRRYGTRLQYDNGRDGLKDAYQEALDLCCYLRQAIGEPERAVVEPERINPGIRSVVDLLQSESFNTTDSGDGVSNAGMGCEMDVPNVHIVCDTPRHLIRESKRLARLLKFCGVDVGAGHDDRPFIQATYNPADDTPIISLIGLDDALLKSALETER